MQKWMHTNLSDLAAGSKDLQLSDGWEPSIQLRRQPTGFSDDLDTAGVVGDRLQDFSWPRAASEPQTHCLLTAVDEAEQPNTRVRPRSLDESSLTPQTPPPPPPRWSQGSSGDSSDSAWFLDNDDSAASGTTDEGEEEDTEFLFVPQGGNQPELKSIQEILREGGSSSMFSSSALPSNGRCLYPILEESSDEISDASASEDEDDGDAAFRLAAEVDRGIQLHQVLTGKLHAEELKDENKSNSRRSSSTSTSTSTCSESFEASVDFEQQQPPADPERQPQQLQTVEDMRRWSLRLQPQQLDAIAEAESASSSASASSSDNDDETSYNDGSKGVQAVTGIVKNNTHLANVSDAAPVRVVASSRAQVHDASGRPTGDEASAITEATGATVGVAVARAAARAASIATSTVVRSGGGSNVASRYRILISTHCDVEHRSAMTQMGADVKDGWCQPIEDSKGHFDFPEREAEGEHILKLLPALGKRPQASSSQCIHTVVTEEQLLVKSSEACAPQPEASVESAYIVSSGDEGSSSETESDEATESDAFHTSESEAGTVQWTELRAQAAAYRSVLQQQHPQQEPASALSSVRHDTHSGLQLDQERLHRAKEMCLKGQNSLREQLLGRGHYQSACSDVSKRSKPTTNKDGSQGCDSSSAVSHPLRELLDDNLARIAHNPQQKLRCYRSTDLDNLDDLDSVQIPQSGTVISMLETQPGQFNSVSLFDLSRSALTCNGLGATFSLSLMETNIDTGEETHRGVVRETDVDTMQHPPVVQSPGSIKKRSRSLLNLTGSVDSKDRESAAEVGVGNAISRSSTKRKSKRKKRKSFIERLEERATTDPEREICRSLSRLRIPTWMDKVPLNGCSSAPHETRYSRHKAEAARNSVSVNDLAVSEALKRIQASEVVSDEATMEVAAEEEEGYLQPIILSTSVSLPCLLAVRPEESHSMPDPKQASNSSKQSAGTMQPSAAIKTRSELLREGQEVRRQRLVDLQSRMQRPSLEPVMLIPTDFLPKTSVQKPPLATARRRPALTSSARPDSLALPGTVIAVATPYSITPQSGTAHHAPPPPPPLPPRSNPESLPSARAKAISMARAAIADISNRTALRFSTDSSDAASPTATPPPVQKQLTKVIVIATDATASTSKKQTNESNNVPSPPPRGPEAKRLSGREEAIMIATAAITAMTKETASKASDAPPPPPRRKTAQFLSPYWQGNPPPNGQTEFDSQSIIFDQVHVSALQKSPQINKKHQKKSSSPQLQRNHQAVGPENSFYKQGSQSPRTRQSSRHAQPIIKPENADHSRERLIRTSPQISRHLQETPTSRQQRSHPSDMDGLDNFTSYNSSDDFPPTFFHCDPASQSWDNESPADGLEGPASFEQVRDSSRKAITLPTDSSPSQSSSDRNGAESNEESTVVQTSVVYRRIVCQTVESPRGESEGNGNSDGAEIEPTTVDSVLSCQMKPEMFETEAHNGLLALVDSQLEQFGDSLAELENDGFNRVGKYAEMIAALKAARDESLSSDLHLDVFGTVPAEDAAVCQRTLVDWLLCRPDTHRRMAHLARASHRCLGRGCVLLMFALSDDFKLPLLKPPVYAPVGELRDAAATAAPAELIDVCGVYNPEDEFIVYLATGRARLWARLRAEPQREQTPQPQPKERRQLFVASLRRSLRDRGVSLRHHYPELHELLEAYIDTGEAFTPVTIRPVDAVSGREFACSIAVPTVKDGDWWASEHLLGGCTSSSVQMVSSAAMEQNVPSKSIGKVVSTEL